MNTLDQIKEIQKFYELESNIPTNHPYWDLLDKYRDGVLDTPKFEFNEGSLYMMEPKPEPFDSAKVSLLRIKIQAILTAHGNKEPNIPFTNEYWYLQNQLKAWVRLEQ